MKNPYHTTCRYPWCKVDMLIQEPANHRKKEAPCIKASAEQQQEQLRRLAYREIRWQEIMVSGLLGGGDIKENRRRNRRCFVRVGWFLRDYRQAHENLVCPTKACGNGFNPNICFPGDTTFKVHPYRVYAVAENGLDVDYAKALGADVDALLISQPDSGEEALNIAEMLIKSGTVDVVVVDSVAALVPQAELDGVIGDMHVARQARMMSQAMRKLSTITARSKIIIIFINQLREKIGVMFGSPEVTPGGRALKFYSSVRIDLRKSELIKLGEDVIGNKVKVKVVKNKVAPPFRKCEFYLFWPLCVRVINYV